MQNFINWSRSEVDIIIKLFKATDSSSYALSPASVCCHWSQPGSRCESNRKLHKTGKVSGISYIIFCAYNNQQSTIIRLCSSDYLNFLQSEELCQYDYAVEQQYFDGDARQNVTISADIEVFCNSSNNIICLLN